MSHVRRRPARAAALLFSLPFAACGGSHEGEHAHEDEEHGAQPAARREPDAHHAAENRPDCEEDVVLPAGALERYGIEVGPASMMALVPEVRAPGHLAFPEGAVARVGSLVGGRVLDVLARSGSDVEPGAPLFTLESAGLGEAQNAHLLARATAAAALAAVELARGSFERATRLHESVQGIALTELQRREAELRQAERDRDLAHASSAAARQRLALLGMDEPAILELERTGALAPRATLVAPIAGRVLEVNVTRGELVGSGDDRLVVIGDLSTLWAVAEVSESRLAEVALGAPVRVHVGALSERTFTGRVAALPGMLEVSTRTAEVRIELPNPDRSLLPGMYVQVDIDSSRGAGAPVLAVPDAAVSTIEGAPVVFVPIEPGGTAFCKHEIEVGAAIGEHIPVLAGLKPGETIVTSGVFRLKAELVKASAQHEH